VAHGCTGEGNDQARIHVGVRSQAPSLEIIAPARGVLEDPWAPPPADAYQFTVDHKDAPDEPQTVIVSFEKGKPVALDGKPMGLV